MSAIVEKRERDDVKGPVRSSISICWKGRWYIIARDPYEPDKTAYERLWWIIDQKPKTKKEFVRATLQSRYHIAQKYMSCRY
jgi:hypothetical protein